VTPTQSITGQTAVNVKIVYYKITATSVFDPSAFAVVTINNQKIFRSSAIHDRTSFNPEWDSIAYFTKAELTTLLNTIPIKIELHYLDETDATKSSIYRVNGVNTVLSLSYDVTTGVITGGTTAGVYDTRINSLIVTGDDVQIKLFVEQFKVGNCPGGPPVVCPGDSTSDIFERATFCQRVSAFYEICVAQTPQPTCVNAAFKTQVAAVAHTEEADITITSCIPNSQCKLSTGNLYKIMFYAPEDDTLLLRRQLIEKALNTPNSFGTFQILSWANSAVNNVISILIYISLLLVYII